MNILTVAYGLVIVGVFLVVAISQPMMLVKVIGFMACVFGVYALAERFLGR